MSEDTSATEQPEVFTPFEFDVLDITKDAQNQHGLRQSDYQRYRTYCSNRIKKIRSTLEVKGKSKKFKPFIIDEQNVKDQRVILLVLFSAERAWSYSMELKEEITDEPRKRVHMINRLKKAAKLSEQLERICSNGCCEEKTVKNVIAYSKWLKGLLNVEQQKWNEALTSLSESKKIYEEISKTGKPHQVALCNARIEEIDVPVRYCQYKLGMISLGQESSKSNEESSQLTQIDWLGKVLSIKNENIREFLIDAQLKESDLKKALDKKDNETAMQLFDKILMCYGDALKCSKQDIKTNEEAAAKAKSAKGDEMIANLKLIDSYLSYIKIMKVVERNTRLAIEKESQLESPLLKQTLDEKASRPQDLIKLYDTNIQNWQEASSLYGVEKNAKLSQEIESRILMNKSFKCFFSAMILEYGQRWQDSNSLYERAGEYLQKAKQSYSECEPLKEDMKKDLGELTRLEKNIRARKSSVRASSFLESQEKKDSTQVNETLWEAIQSYDSTQSIPTDLVDFQNPKIVSFPPPIEPIPLKPFFFDMAGGSIDYPDLSSRTKPKAGGITGLISSFWGRK